MDKPHHGSDTNPGRDHDVPDFLHVLAGAEEIAILAVDDTGLIHGFNAGAQKLLGYSAEEVVGRLTLSYFEAEADGLGSTSSAQPMGSDSMPNDRVWLRRDGEKITVELTVARGTGVNGCESTSVILARPVALDLAMREQLRLRSAALEATENAVIITDTEGIICWVNPAFTHLTGYTAAEVVGHNTRILRSGSHPRSFYAGMWDTICAGNVWRGEMLNKRKDGSTYFEEMTITPVCDAAGNIHHFVAVKTDVTQRKRQEVMLRDAIRAAESAAKAKSDFLAVMSHEIRTPMNGVIGLSNLLRGTELNSSQRRYVDTIHTCGEALLSVINQILDFSKLEAGKIELEQLEFNLRELVEDTLEMVAGRAAEKNLELIACVGNDVPERLRGDAGRLRQILLNLLGNAVKFTSSGDVAVEVDCQRDSDGSVLLRFDVADTGIGMSDEAVQRLFQPFMQADTSTTRRYGGTGLGLAIARQLVELMGGQISVISKVNAGTTFRFDVRLERASSGTVPTTLRTEHRALVAVRSQKLARAISINLESAGWECENVTDFDAARAKFAATAGTDRHFQAFIAEPPTVNPANACPPDLRMIWLTPWGSDRDEHAGATRQDGRCVSKPVKRARLLDALNADPNPGMATADAGNPPESATTILPHAKDLRILFAEDNIVNQMVGVDQLAAIGVRADVVADGQEAVEAIQRIQYDVVLMDCMMPEMDGYEAARRIRQLEREQPPGFEGRRPVRIVAMTANALPGDREQCIAAGMDDYITKPVCDEDLRRALKASLILDSPAPANVKDCQTGIRPNPTPSPEDDEPAIDLERLSQITSFNPARSARLLRLYLENADASLHELTTAVANHETDQIRTTAHRWSGSSSTCGLRRLSRHLSKLEADARAGNLSGADDVLHRTREVYLASRSTLEQRLAALGEPGVSR